MGMILWRGKDRLEKGTNDRRMPLNRQRGQEQSSFYHGHKRAGRKAGVLGSRREGEDVGHRARAFPDAPLLPIREDWTRADRPQLVPGQCGL